MFDNSAEAVLDSTHYRPRQTQTIELPFLPADTAVLPQLANAT